MCLRINYKMLMGNTSLQSFIETLWEKYGLEFVIVQISEK